MPHKASNIAEAHLKRVGVSVYLNTDYSKELKEDLGYDYVIDCTGYKFNATKSFMQGDLQECLDS